MLKGEAGPNMTVLIDKEAQHAVLPCMHMHTHTCTHTHTKLLPFPSVSLYLFHPSPVLPSHIRPFPLFFLFPLPLSLLSVFISLGLLISAFPPSPLLFLPSLPFLPPPEVYSLEASPSTVLSLLLPNVCAPRCIHFLLYCILTVPFLRLDTQKPLCYNCLQYSVQ